MGETVCSGSGARTADLGRDPAAWGTGRTEDWVSTRVPAPNISESHR